MCDKAGMVEIVDGMHMEGTVVTTAERPNSIGTQPASITRLRMH